MKKLEKHIGYYISLFAILGTGFAIIFLSFDRSLQILSLVLTAFFYVLWGIIHHLIHHNLTAKIVVEYSLMGALGIAIVFFILKGGFGL